MISTPACPPLLLGCSIALGMLPGGTLLAADDAERFGDANAKTELTTVTSTVDSGKRRSGTRLAGLPRWDVLNGHALIGGDMLIGKVDASGELLQPAAVRGFAHNRLLDRWPDGIVPFELDVTMSADQREKVRAAIAHWTERTRMTFVERGNERADVYDGWLRFVPEGGCASYVGRHPDQPQPLYVQNCTTGSIIHEIGHAVGLYHEHTRPDRDNFIEIEPDNIISGREHNFEILFTNTQTQGEYDYDSIMHYGPQFFSRNGSATIVAPGNRPIGQRVGLSDGDISAVDRMYATDLSLAIDSTEREVTGANGAGTDGFEIDVAVRNIGSLGAHDLSLQLAFGDAARWLSVSENSGWDCTTSESILTCTRSTLTEGDSSRFVLHVDAGGADADALSASVASRTMDTDPSNNTLNDDTADALPTVAAAQPKDEPAEPATEAGGGGSAGWPLALVALVAGLRRRRVRT